MAKDPATASARPRPARVALAVLAVLVMLVSGAVLPVADAAFTGGDATTSSFVASTAFSYTAAMQYDHPTFYLRLSDPAGSATLADSSGNAASAVNPVPADGTAPTRYQVPGAPTGDGDTGAHFDGGSYVVANTADPAGTSDYSIELWFRVTGSGGGMLAGNGDPVPNATGWSRMLYVDAGGRLTYGDWTLPTYTPQTVRSAANVDDGTWHHAVGTHTGNTLTLYLDGVSQGSVASPAQTYNLPWTLGGFNTNWSGWPDQPPSNYITGDLDDFSYYRAGLSAAQVTAHLAATAGPGYRAAVLADGPALFWRLDDPPYSVNTTDSTGNDYTGAYYLTNQIVSGFPGALTTTPDNATWFSGRGTYAYDATPFTDPEGFTAEVWLKTPARRGGVLFGFNTSTGGPSLGFDRTLWLQPDGRLAWGIWVGSPCVVYSTASYNDDQWHMAAASLGSAGLRLYVDGALVGSNAGCTGAQSYTGYWRLGDNSLGGWSVTLPNEMYTGFLDEFAVVPAQLPDSRIAELYGVR